MLKGFEELFREHMEVEAEIIHLQERGRQIREDMLKSVGMNQRSMAVELASGDTVILIDDVFKLEVIEGK